MHSAGNSHTVFGHSQACMYVRRRESMCVYVCVCASTHLRGGQQGAGHGCGRGIIVIEPGLCLGGYGGARTIGGRTQQGHPLQPLTTLLHVTAARGGLCVFASVCECVCVCVNTLVHMHLSAGQARQENLLSR